MLTLDEEENIEGAVRSMLEQTDVRLEVIVVDSASRDQTVSIVRRIAQEDPRLRLYTSFEYLSVGEARNIGLQVARASRIAFMSADATAAPGWAQEALTGLDEAHIVYGRQVHAPGRPTAAAAARGMRYHHFRHEEDEDPAAFASNVNAAIRKEVFDHLRYVDDRDASALDDILFTREARQLGYKIAYRNGMLVRHKDTTTMRQEFIKNRREGRGWGILAPRLGLHRMVLAWFVLLVAALGLLVAVPHFVSLLVLALVLYAPTLRRAARSLTMLRQAPVSWLGGLLVSPFFDLAFLTAYLGGLLHRRPDHSGIRRPQGA